MNCLFCKIVHGEIPAHKIFENVQFLAFRDINPQAPHHFLIIPKKHIRSINEASAEDEVLLGQLLLTAQEVAKQEGLMDKGYRLVINTNDDGGQTVYHIHLHILGGRQLTWPPG